MTSDCLPHQEGSDSSVAAFRMTRTYDHEAIRAHPFFEGARARDLYKQKVPLPMLSEIAMREVMMKVRAEGSSALGTPTAIARWPAPFKERIGFECIKRELLTDELRGYLGMGAKPTEIEDDLDDVMLREQLGADGATEDKEDEDDEDEGSEDEDERRDGRGMQERKGVQDEGVLV